MFANSDFGQALKEDTLMITDDRPLPGRIQKVKYLTKFKDNYPLFYAGTTQPNFPLSLLEMQPFL